MKQEDNRQILYFKPLDFSGSNANLFRSIGCIICKEGKSLEKIVSQNNNDSINILPDVSLPINVQSNRFMYSLNVKKLLAKDYINGLYPRTEISTSPVQGYQYPNETTNVLQNFLKGKKNSCLFTFSEIIHTMWSILFP